MKFVSSVIVSLQSYSSRLATLKFEDPVTKENLMGNEDTSTKQSLFSKTAQLRNKGTTFTIGNRGEILSQQLEGECYDLTVTHEKSMKANFILTSVVLTKPAPILVPHAQQKNQYPYEALFRSEQYALVDNACREYLFGTEFFIVRGTQAQDLFNQIMGKTLTLLIVCIDDHFK